MSRSEQPADRWRESPYQAQLTQGFALLRFRPPLELEFREHLQRQARTIQRLGGLLLMLVAGGYLLAEFQVLDVGAYPWSAELTWLRLLQMLVGALVLGISFQEARPLAFTNRLLGFLLVLVGMITARIDLLYEVAALPQALRYGVGILVVCTFFYLSATFWWALLCAQLIVLADAVLAWQALSREALRLHGLATTYYLLLLGLCAISRYAQEYAQREQFLVRRLLGWMAEHDGLTGLSNRRSFDVTLLRLLAQAQRERRPLCLLLVDLDEFKGYNDRLGHPAGDRLLQDFAELLGGFARRPLDLAARVGGEEFGLLLFDCDERDARLIAEELLAALRERAFAHPASTRSPWVTASIGIAGARHEEPAERLYKHADDALYRAKALGRDRCEVFRDAE